ncbi:MAG: hypothetical protein LHV68_13085 [Elusimicrobia bacterium]|nr:hypothetical protein [Candidatus Liberimonas magnetica]
MDIINTFINVILIGCIYYFRNYLKKKGENIATKEDIHEITDKIESVKQTYAKKNRVRLA